MVDRHVVLARIAKIREYVALLRKIRGMAGESRFVKDPGDFEAFIKAVSKLL